MIDLDGCVCKSCERLKEENERLHSLLVAHGIFDAEIIAKPTQSIEPLEQQALSFKPTEKIALFRRLFRGRTGVNRQPNGATDRHLMEPLKIA